MVDFGSVLTGDLIGSSKLRPEELASVRDSLRLAVSHIAPGKANSVASTIDMFRGDSWQLFLEDTGRCLRVSIYLRAVLRAHFDTDTRIAIGIGSIDRLDHGSVSLSIGDAFSRSGRALERLSKQKKHHNLMTLDFAESSSEMATLPDLAVKLCDAIVSRWTANQAAVVSMSLLGKTQHEITRQLTRRRSQQAVAKTLGRASWNAIEEAIRSFERMDWRSFCF